MKKPLPREPLFERYGIECKASKKDELFENEYHAQTLAVAKDIADAKGWEWESKGYDVQIRIFKASYTQVKYGYKKRK